MFTYRNVFLIFVGLCTVTGCKAQDDYLSEISSNAWSGCKALMDESFSYLHSTGSKIADTVSSHYDEYSKTKTASVIRDAYDDTYSYVRSGGNKIVDTVSSYYKEYTPQSSELDVSEEQVNRDHSETGNTKSSENIGYEPLTSEPDALKNNAKTRDSEIVNTESSKPKLHSTKDEIKDEDNSHEKMLRKCAKLMNDISDEALSRRIVNMLLSKTHLKPKNAEEGILFWGNFGLMATASQLEALHNFTRGKLTLREVAPILDDVLLQDIESDAVYKFACLIRSTMKILFDFINLYRNIIGTTVILSYLYWLFNNAKCNIKSILLTGIQVIFIVTFLVTWWEVVHEENMESLPIQCQHTTRQTMDRTMSQPFSPECQMYHDAKMERLQFGNLLHTAFIHTFERVTWIAAIFGKNIGSILSVVLAGILRIILSVVEYVIRAMERLPWFHIVVLSVTLWIFHKNYLPFQPDFNYSQDRTRNSRRY